MEALTERSINQKIELSFGEPLDISFLKFGAGLSAIGRVASVLAIDILSEFFSENK